MEQLKVGGIGALERERERERGGEKTTGLKELSEANSLLRWV